MLEQGKVKVYIEKADAKDGFHHATCILPEYRWEDIFGFTQEDIAGYQKMKIQLILLSNLQKAEDSKMPQVFKIGSYWAYLGTNENDPLEPVHVHVAEGSPQPNATKIWIEIVTECQKYLDDYSNCLLANNNSNIPTKTLRNIMRIIESQHQIVLQKWMQYFDQIQFYC